MRCNNEYRRFITRIALAARPPSAAAEAVHLQAHLNAALPVLRPPQNAPTREDQPQRRTLPRRASPRSIAAGLGMGKLRVACARPERADHRIRRDQVVHAPVRYRERIARPHRGRRALGWRAPRHRVSLPLPYYRPTASRNRRKTASNTLDLATHASQKRTAAASIGSSPGHSLALAPAHK